MGEDKTVYSPKYVGGTDGGYGMGFGGGGAGLLFGLVLGSALNRGHGGFFGGDGCCDNGSGGFANWSKLESIENQITNNNITEQFIATNANINNAARDTALGFLGASKEMCEHSSKSDLQFALTNKNIDDSKCEILSAMKDQEIQGLRDKLLLQSQAAQTTAIEGMFMARGLFEGSGPVITAHEPAHARDNDNLALLLANQQANSLNLAFNSGIQAGAFGQGQAAAQGLGQGAVQK